ncbi:MAG: MarR family transcriptional regulator [Candidatus Caldatribacteriota bacterium]|nr:MarR family transcriptional regulator [Candidatus Caldatribacteriota bacterium]
MEKSLLDLIIELKRGCTEDEEHIRTVCNISLAEYKGITQIDIEKRVTCNTLSQKMGLSPSRGSRIIDSLVRRGYFLRTTNPEDRRSFVISLSSNGLKIRKRIEQERSGCEARIRKKFSKDQVEMIKKALDLVSNIFE